MARPPRIGRSRGHQREAWAGTGARSWWRHVDRSAIRVRKPRRLHDPCGTRASEVFPTDRPVGAAKEAGTVTVTPVVLVPRRGRVVTGLLDGTRHADTTQKRSAAAATGHDPNDQQQRKISFEHSTRRLALVMLGTGGGAESWEISIENAVRAAQSPGKPPSALQEPPRVWLLPQLSGRRPAKPPCCWSRRRGPANAGRTSPRFRMTFGRAGVAFG
jgi:hypothetical protein